MGNKKTAAAADTAAKSDTVVPVVVAAPEPAASTDPVADKLKALGVDTAVIQNIKDVLGATTEDDLLGLTEADLVEAGMKKLPARNLLKVLVPTVAVVTPSPVGVGAASRVVSTVRLQDAPQQTNWLASLCAIQPQRIQPLTVVTGIKASMADVYGYFQLPKKMMVMLRQASEAVGLGVPDLYFELQNLTQARRYGTLVAWMKGKGSACTITERNRFLLKMHEQFWNGLDTFYNELNAWKKGRRDSLDVGESMAAAMSGETQIYDATLVRNAALALGDMINRTFAGTGVYAATALALDNDLLQKVIEEMDFRQFGVQSREMLLANLGCAVPAEIVAAENTISKFIWNAMDIKNQAAGSADEQRFLVELDALGTSRPWNQIKAQSAKAKQNRTSGLGGIGSAAGFDEDDEDDKDV